MVTRYPLNHINIRAEYKRKNNFKYLLRRVIAQIYIKLKKHLISLKYTKCIL